MKVVKVEGNAYSSTFEPQFYPFWAGTRIHTKRDAVIYKVSTDEGYVGYGEGSLGGLKYLKDINETIVGEDPSNIEGIWKKVGLIIKDEATLYPAMAGIDVALYDIVGKATGKSVCELLGGRKRDKVRVYSSAGLYQPPEGYAREARSFAELGFKGYKFRPGIGPKGDLEAVKAIRDAVGDDFKIMVDAHTWWGALGGGGFSYSPATVRLLAKEFVKLNVYFLEEAFSPNDLVLFRDLKKTVPELKLSAGEREHSLSGFKKLMEESDVDIVQPDVGHLGYAMCKKVVEMARKNRKMIVNHVWGTRLASIQNAQLSATLTEEESPWCEYAIFTTDKVKSMYPFPLAEDVLKKPLIVNNSMLKIPEAPGLGVEVNEEALKKYPYVPGPYTYHVYNPSIPIWEKIEPVFR
jgi:L-alanine-DL-glutamate epimerase-like enolase superfamily enzyme